MRIKNLMLRSIDFSLIQLQKVEQVSIYKSLIGTIDWNFTTFDKTQIHIKDCVINTLDIISNRFKEGLVIENNILRGRMRCQLEGNANKPVVIRNNIFNEYFSVLDAKFAGKLIVENNIFMKGSDLLSNADYYKDTFGDMIEMKNNTIPSPTKR